MYSLLRFIARNQQQFPVGLSTMQTNFPPKKKKEKHGGYSYICADILLLMICSAHSNSLQGPAEKDERKFSLGKDQLFLYNCKGN
jgi:hypothetical protein